MLKNYIAVALRHLFKQKGLAFINIAGLSIGLACFCLFLLYAVHEFSFDRFHKDGDLIYRVYRWSEDLDGEGAEGDPSLPLPLGPAMKTDLPDVTDFVRWKGAWRESIVRINGQIRKAELSHADNNLFEIMTFPLKYGNPETALSDPSYVVLTEETAERLFGEKNPTGKSLDIKFEFEEEFKTFTVSAIAENIPSNSSRQFQMVANLDDFLTTEFGRSRINNWSSSFLTTFVKLKEGSGLATNENALNQFRRKYHPDEEHNIREAGRWKGEGPPVTYRLQNLQEMHTDTRIRGGEIPAIDVSSIWTLLAIAGGVLLIAIINFTTLSIGRSAGRAREVGIRKVMGSYRSQLIRQFLSESILLSIIAVFLGILLANLFLPLFNQVSGRELSFSLRQMPEIPWLILSLTLLTGLLAGIYPAFILSKFRPVAVLKNKIRLGGSNLFTKSLVTTQFALSSGLVIATLITIAQLNHLKSKNPGFHKENVLMVDSEGTESEANYPLFKKALSADPAVLGVAASEMGLGAGRGWSRAGFEYKGELKQVYEYYIDDDYLDIMSLELLIGRNFNPERQDGSNMSVIINETMMKEFGWTLENAIGQELSGYSEGQNPRVIGVIKDFHFRSFHEGVKPQMFHQFNGYQPNVYFVRLHPGNPASAIAQMEESWNELAPGFPFTYHFLDDALDRFYRAEERFGKIISWAGGISIILACMGLLGLAALAVVNRTKEIGIRKVLGATPLGIVSLLSKDFLKLVVLALAISIPVSWYLLNTWLQNFPYRVGIEWWMFVWAGIIALVCAFLPVGIQSMRAALSNPVDSLRNE